ncbi:MAG: aryl-sulfate sulfohydrolase, partial [Akkermansiaceae bacterium]
IEYFENGDLELYKLNKDPGEKQNLLNTFPSKAKELQQMLIDWRKKTNAPVPTELNPAFKK